MPIDTFTYDNSLTWFCTVTATDEPMFDRGFTGHEHLYNFGLINMNGRVYDPLMSMFLSPDNFIQSPDNSQNFNRYAYCLNNPLKYTDSDGEMFVIDDLIIVAAIGAIINTTINLASGNINSVGDLFASVAVGAVAGAAGAFVGGAMFAAMPCGGFWGGAASGGAAFSTSYSIMGYGNSRLQGNSVGESLKTAGIEGLKGLAIGAAFGGLTMGLTDYCNGYGFWKGDVTEDLLLGDCSFEDVDALYNAKSERLHNDIVLRDRMVRMYGKPIGEKYNYGNYTTSSSKGYVVLKDGYFRKTKTGGIVAAYNTFYSNGKNVMHVSPYYAIDADDVLFQAATGHEFIHGYHHVTMSNMCIDKDLFNKYTECEAYKYSYDVLMANGYTAEANHVMDVAKSMGCYWNYTRNPRFYLPNDIKMFIKYPGL